MFSIIVFHLLLCPTFLISSSSFLQGFLNWHNKHSTITGQRP